MCIRNVKLITTPQAPACITSFSMIGNHMFISLTLRKLMRVALSGVAIVATTGALSQAHALTIDDFETGSALITSPIAATPGYVVAYTPASIAGGSRDLSLWPAAGTTGFVSYWTGGGVMGMVMQTNQSWAASVGYGSRKAMNLDLSAYNAIRLKIGHLAEPAKLTVYANTEVAPGANADGSGINLDLPMTTGNVPVYLDIPFSSFVTNSPNNRPVRWSDVDTLAFAFSGSPSNGTARYFTIESITAVRLAPTPAR
jgi:hypothetical protein